MHKGMTWIRAILGGAALATALAATPAVAPLRAPGCPTGRDLRR
jgi:hypothetical protein